MKRDIDEDEEANDEDTDRQGNKRVRGATALSAAAEKSEGKELLEVARRQFEEHKAQPQFKAQHHPERLAAGLLAQRERARTMLPGFLADLRAGALTGPNLKSGGLLASLPGAELAPGDKPASPPPPRGPAPMPAHLVKFEPLPSSAVAQARGVLIAAAAGEVADATSQVGSEDVAAKGDVAAAAASASKGKCALVSLLTAERDINDKTRMWAAFGTRAEADAGLRALTDLPQLAELVERPPVQRDVLMPACEAVPPPLSEAEAHTHACRCDELIDALEARLGLPGQADVVRRGAPLDGLSALEGLHVRVLYLRRVHHFDYLGGGQFGSHAALLLASGEAHLPNRCLVYAATRDALAVPIKYDKAAELAKAHTAYLAALSALDVEYAGTLRAAVDAFYEANCVEVEVGKFRCLLSQKLFKDAVYVRKHIDNKWSDNVLAAKRLALESKYWKAFAAESERAAAMPPPPLQPLRFSRRDDDDRSPRGGKGKGFGKGSFDDEMIGGKGKGYGGKGFGKGKGGGRGFGNGATDGRLPEGAVTETIPRPIDHYRDLDDDELFK